MGCYISNNLEIILCCHLVVTCVLGLEDFNPFIPKIRKLILLTDDHTFFCWLVLRISKQYHLVDNFLISHCLCAWQCIKIVRRIYIPFTPGSQRVKGEMSSR